MCSGFSSEGLFCFVAAFHGLDSIQDDDFLAGKGLATRGETGVFVARALFLTPNSLANNRLSIIKTKVRERVRCR